jgi:sulfur-oxidizing protein SoxY
MELSMKRHFAYVSLLFALTASAAAGVAPAAPSDPNRVWAGLKQMHFQGRTIQSGAGVIGLEAPLRAEDAAIVPISIHGLLPANGDRRIEKIWLIIDQNPIPMSALFRIAKLAGPVDIATRVRVDAYSHMRAIAQTDDGRLYMATRFVKASGGCSAPASKDPEAALANMGEMRLKTYNSGAAAGKPRLVQVMLRHPNHTGLQMNQLTRLYVPAHFVKKILVDYAGEPVLDVETTFSLSEDPSLRFSFAPREPGQLWVRVVDSEALEFSESIIIRPKAAQVAAH